MSFLQIDVLYDGQDPHPILKHSVPGIVLGFLVSLRLPPLQVLKVIDARQVRVNIVGLADALLDTPEHLQKQVNTFLQGKVGDIVQRATRHRANTLCGCERCEDARNTLRGMSEKSRDEAKSSAEPVTPSAPPRAPDAGDLSQVSYTDAVGWNADVVTSPSAPEPALREPVLRQYVRHVAPVNGYLADRGTDTPVLFQGKPVKAPMLAITPLHKPPNPRAPRD